jgi:hypothetical protein
MSTHQELELFHSTRFVVTAATHLSGPYSISKVMRDLMFSQSNYLFQGYIPYVILGYQEVYGNLYEELSDIFQPDFIPLIEAFYNGELNLIELTIGLVFLSSLNFNNSFPVNLFYPSLVNDITENDDHPINVILRENDTYNWSPQAPTRIFYCMGDEMVPYGNSLLADSVLQANGAVDLVTKNLNSDMGHGECVVPALLETINFFKGFVETSEDFIVIQNEISLYPNPTDGMISISGPTEFSDCHFQVIDFTGKILMNQPLYYDINLGHLQSGMYFIRISWEMGISTHRIIRK